jgi:hypothetical protein
VLDRVAQDETKDLARIYFFAQRKLSAWDLASAFQESLITDRRCVSFRDPDQDQAFDSVG